jgi:hypothetical protein
MTPRPTASEGGGPLVCESHRLGNRDRLTIHNRYQERSGRQGRQHPTDPAWQVSPGLWALAAAEAPKDAAAAAAGEAAFLAEVARLGGARARGSRALCSTLRPLYAVFTNTFGGSISPKCHCDQTLGPAAAAAPDRRRRGRHPRGARGVAGRRRGCAAAAAARRRALEPGDRGALRAGPVRRLSSIIL